MANSGNEPDDAVRMRQLLESMGVEEYEPRVVHQLLDFMYGYVSGVLQDAEAYGERAGTAKGVVEVEDVLTAIQAHAAFSFVQPPSQDVLAALAAKRNAQPLPELGKAHGLRLPPEDACLTAPTWQLPRPAQVPAASAGAASGASAGTAGGGRSGRASAGTAAGGGGGGLSDMDVDGADGAGGAYPWRAQGGGNANGGGSRRRPPLNVNPGEAPDD